MSYFIHSSIPDDATHKELCDQICYWRSIVLELTQRKGQLIEECNTLQRKVDWLMKADKLIIWDGEQWKVRTEALPEGRR